MEGSRGEDYCIRFVFIPVHVVLSPSGGEIGKSYHGENGRCETMRMGLIELRNRTIEDISHPATRSRVFAVRIRIAAVVEEDSVLEC